MLLKYNKENAADEVFNLVNIPECDALDLLIAEKYFNGTIEKYSTITKFAQMLIFKLEETVDLMVNDSPTNGWVYGEEPCAVIAKEWPLAVCLFALEQHGHEWKKELLGKVDYGPWVVVEA
ncbi:hypothetical protein P9578_30620 [Brevibacillus choshinensis]|uniref:hypothetical protein n=1 Tax=Brevibacillus choshinensis TaxID=54911 RepID=UPI002E23F4CB|nr:hypothetical protein [Brevibacillus choshinensis]